MNNMNFNLKDLDNFNSLQDSKKKNILLKFNLNRYRFILNEMKSLYDYIEDKKILEGKMSKLFEEGCLNFHIINSNYSCNIYVGQSYFLYFNDKNNKYYLYVLKREQTDFEEFKGKFKLNDDLIWKKIE